MKYLLDTHTWVWWNTRPDKLSTKVVKLIEDSKIKLLLSTISIWEFSKLVELGKIELKLDGMKWIEKALMMPRLTIVELSPAIAWKSTQLPQPFHRDPADQIIVSTAREENATILTKDTLISSYPHVLAEW